MWKKLILLSSCVLLIVWLIGGRHPARHQGCAFTALDIGQGDSLLIQTSDHQDILIDGGPDDSVIQQLSRVLPPGDRDLELIVLTHPHADHVNGLVAVMNHFTVRRVLTTGVHFHETAYEAWQQEIQQKHIPTLIARAGQRYTIGAATLDVLWPALDLSRVTITKDNAGQGGGVNDASIVMRLSCDGSQAMLMGDASSDIEQRLLDGHDEVQADLLKVGHHGSRFSSSPAFLAAVQPHWAVISSGLGNRYGHPHPTALLHLEKTGATILRTDQQGTISLETDGLGHWRLRP